MNMQSNYKILNRTTVIPSQNPTIIPQKVKTMKKTEQNTSNKMYNNY